MSIEYSYPKIEIVANYQCGIGENPIWNPIDRRMYWCDIPTGRIFRYDPISRSHEQCYQGDIVGGFTVQSDGSLLLFMAHAAIKIWRDGQLKTVIEGLADEESSRFNDVIADPCGRVFCGTMSTEEHLGKLYRLEPDGSIEMVLEGVGCSNGMAFSLDRRHMYYTDSFAREIYLFDYEQKAGSLRNRRVFARIAEGEGLPDGATLDAEGYLWSAIWDGGQIRRYLPNGGEDMRIAIPAKKVSSLAFGENDYSALYVTTAGGDDCQSTDRHAAGALLRLSLGMGIRGIPEFLSRVGI